MRSFISIFLPLTVAIAVNGQSLMAQGDRSPKILIDPGHGGADNGARLSGYGAEKVFALNVALAIAGALARHDIAHELTRSDDQFLEILDRVNRASESGADALLSIHSSPDPSTGPFAANVLVRGADPESYTLANLIANELRRSGANQVAISEADLRILSPTGRPSVFLEFDGITSFDQQWICESIAEPIATAVGAFLDGVVSHPIRTGSTCDE